MAGGALGGEQELDRERIAAAVGRSRQFVDQWVGCYRATGYIEDRCETIWDVVDRGRFGEAYKVGGNNEITDRKITETILRQTGKD